MIEYMKGIERSEITFADGLEAYIHPDNPVRFIDAFVDTLDLIKLGFQHTAPRRKGRPGYAPATMLKIYIYGYLNREHSSRRLERAAETNIEMMWLTEKQAPDYTTIANFRKDNGKPICAVCDAFTNMCREGRLFADSKVVVDGSKFKAVNSPDKNVTMAKINKQIKSVERHIDQYLKKLEVTDKEEEAGLATSLGKTIADRKEHLFALNELKQKVEDSPDKQISFTDPDSRSMRLGGSGSMVGYNVQIAVEDTYHLIVSHEVTNAPTDSNQLYSIASKAQEAVGRTDITVIADKCYYNGVEVVKCNDAGMTALISKKQQPGRASKGLFLRTQFIYDKERDLYVCPAGQELPKKYSAIEHGLQYNAYSDRACCKDCKLKSQCIDIKTDKIETSYKKIMRWESEHKMEEMQTALEKVPDAMRTRQSTVEHPFGTMKFWMGSVHFLTKGLKKVSTETSLIVMGYNLRRMINLFGTSILMNVI
jgi:transposase